MRKANLKIANSDRISLNKLTQYVKELIETSLKIFEDKFSVQFIAIVLGVSNWTLVMLIFSAA